MHPESELLFLGARVALRDGHRDRMAELSRAGPDWDRVLGLAAFHGVLPLLGHNLETLEPGLIPAAVLDGVRRRLKGNAAKNLFMLSELIHVARLLDQAGIESVHFKGPVLAVHAFRNPALRDFVDLDILIHHADARRTRDLLHENGFVSTLSPQGEELHLRKSYWLGFAHATTPSRIDLHWKLADPFFRYEPDLPSLWANVQTVSIGGEDINTFGPEDSVMVLAAHGFKHAFSRLKWVCDLSEWIRAHEELDWAGIRTTARSLHVTRLLAISLLLVDRYDDSVIPGDVTAAMAEDARAVGLAAQLWDRIFAGAAPMSGFSEHRFLMRGRERVRDRFAYASYQCVRSVKKAVVPNELDRAMVRLPSSLGFLYYLLRPIRLCGKLLPGRKVDEKEESGKTE